MVNPRFLFCRVDVDGTDTCCDRDSREFTVRVEVLNRRAVVVGSAGKMLAQEMLLFREVGCPGNYARIEEDCRKVAARLLDGMKPGTVLDG